MARATVQHGDSKNWYGMLAYLAFGLFGFLYAAYQYSEGFNVGAQMSMSLVLFAIIVGGLVTYPLLFKDAMFLSRSGQRWQPAWWKYVALGLGLPVVVYFIGDTVAPDAANFAVALMWYTVSTLGVNATYLYQRHKYIGRP